MQSFDTYLKETGEIGYVRELIGSVAWIEGLPGARTSDIVIFEKSQVGQVLSLTREYVEVLVLSTLPVRLGTKVARMNKPLEVSIGDALLGHTLDSLGNLFNDGKLKGNLEPRPMDIVPPGIISRAEVTDAFETGISMVDLAVPLARGQRELVVGDRKTGKAAFLQQVILAQAQAGTVCIYAAIGKKQQEIKRLEEYFQAHAIADKTIIVASASSDPAGLVYLTPYTAMAIAEYFRDKGINTLIVLDDLVTHAKYYREVALLAKRFPGRSSYPGDVFYIHSRLLERAGNFINPMDPKKTVSITCMPVADTVVSDLSGYIQTNLMSATDGHIFFDKAYFDQGRRPAINPFLSVTRIGHQAQRPLNRDLSRQLSRFLVGVEKVENLMHFGSELSGDAKKNLELGDKMFALFTDTKGEIVPINASTFLLGALWAGFWRELETKKASLEMDQIILSYKTNSFVKRQIDELIKSSNSFSDLVKNTKHGGRTIIQKATEKVKPTK